jgi:two-component system, OmpR family, alkaline phosphatase synthesis response regulator PhoP
MMPKMNGFEVCEVIKGDKDLSSIHVIMVTAKGQEFDRAHGNMVGADEYMTKPFDPDEVLKRAAEVLGVELP